MSDEVNSPPNTKSLLIPAHPLLGREENMKLLFDKVLKDVHGTAVDDQINRDLANARARLDIRSERHGVSYDKTIDAIVALAIANLNVSTQVGQTEAQQTVSPARTGTPEEILNTVGTSAAGIATANQQVATNIAQLATALIPIIGGTSGVVSIQTLAAVLSEVVAAVGKGSGTAA